MGRDLSPELQDILRRNGMQGHIVRQGDGFALAVQGHDSPLLHQSAAVAGYGGLGNQFSQQESLQHIRGYNIQRLLSAKELRSCP